MLVDAFVTVMPLRTTSCGRRGWAMASRFCTCTAAMSWFVPISKVATIRSDPSFDDCDRKYSSPVGYYEQTVSGQFYPYVRPQENGNKTDIRWWQLSDPDGRGLKITSDVLFNASALHYTTDDLDDGEKKHQRHSGELKERQLTTLNIDLEQMGLGCIDSWGSWPLKEHQMLYKDYEFRFLLTPVIKN